MILWRYSRLLIETVYVLTFHVKFICTMVFPVVDSTWKSNAAQPRKEVMPDLKLIAPTMVETGLIVPDPNQPRKTFDEAGLKQLAASIKADGIIQPLVVTPKAGGAGFVLVAGERRLRAAKMLGLKAVPVVPALEVSFTAALAENISREDLNPIDKAAALEQLTKKTPQKQVAERLGLSTAEVSNSIRLLELPDKVKAMLRDRRLSAGHGKALLGIKPELREAIAEKAAKGMSVRDVEAMATQKKPRKANKSAKAKASLLAKFFQAFENARAAGLLKTMPAAGNFQLTQVFTVETERTIVLIGAKAAQEREDLYHVLARK